MKQAAVGIAGFLYGLVLSFVYVFVASHYNWSPTDKMSVSCYPNDCGIFSRVALVLDVCAPILIFTVLNVVAWKRWPAKRWLIYFGCATTVICAYWLIGYVIERR